MRRNPDASETRRRGGGRHGATIAASMRTALLLLVLAMAAVYVTGWCRLARRSPRPAAGARPDPAGHARGEAAGHARLALGVAGLATLAVALVSPLDDLAHERFPAHMVQHLLLVAVAAPALVAADGLAATLWGLPAGPRAALGAALRPGRPLRRALRVAVAAPCAWLLHAGAMWLWHLPVLYDAALDSPALHVAEHAAFLGTGILFWVPVLDPAPRLRRRLSPSGRVGYLLLAAFQASALGLLLTAWPAPLYAGYAAAPAALDDQALGGALMWSVTAAADMTAVLITVWRTLGTARETAAPGPLNERRAPGGPVDTRRDRGASRRSRDIPRSSTPPGGLGGRLEPPSDQSVRSPR
jgi:cytochrome c oxidase assembly factor CtaG